MTVSLTTISIRELHEHTKDVLQRIREEGQTVDVLDGDAVIARISPVAVEDERLSDEEWWAEFKRLGEEISRRLPAGTSAVEAVAEQRREL